MEMRVLTSLLTLLILCNTVRCEAAPLFKIDDDGTSCMVEFPKRLLGRDFLIAARMMEMSSADNKAKVYAGQRLYDPILVRFIQADGLLVMQKPDSGKIYPDSSDRKSSAFLRNNIVPSLEAWKIESETDSSLMVNMTKFLTEPMEYLDLFGGKTPGRPIPGMNKILKIESRDRNLEATVRYAFEGAKEPFMAVVRKSLLLLPEIPMQARVHDDRVGFAHKPRKGFDPDKARIFSRNIINRFDIHPSHADIRDYMNGKAVSPEKTVTFYIDDAFPDDWKESIRQGVLDWNGAFREIGFKAPLRAYTFSEAGADFDPFDITANCIYFVASEFPNAVGKHWTDPRSGEIVQADVLFHSEVVNLLKKWYFLQTAAYNPVARMKELPKDVLHSLIRYAVAHEIGHCLGLEHNFKASSAYPTEKLRDRSFTDKFGTTPSIMDYARFNYVAQPGDGVRNVMPPRLGVYDKFAIKVGYTFLPVENSEEVEKWIDSRHSDPMCLYARNSPGAIVKNPTAQTSDLGNDPVASSRYGIANLGRILSDIPDWNATPKGADPFDGMPASYADLQQAYFTYLDHVVSYIGKSPEYSVSGLQFLLKELTDGYRFLIADDVVAYAGNQTDKIINAQKSVIDRMFIPEFVNRICENAEKTGLGFVSYIETVSDAFFADKNPDIILKNLQKNYIAALKSLAAETHDDTYAVDFSPAARVHLASLRERLSADGYSCNYLIESSI